ncbi:mandelate racemase/muconate lactonizing enzyme family protein [Devosia sp. 2618]|uniref:mandelate racemase/muconate lactonizing enzyme family protein n=1 Tax=Devosia sp. 2618 TaxID=3156454 RepID=UPI003398F004
MPSRSATTITRIDVRMVNIPAKFPRKDAIQPFEMQETPMVRIHTAGGAVGTGYTYTLGTGGSAILSLIADTLAPRLIGKDARYVEELWLQLYRSINSINPGMVSSLALAPIDMALWDIRCQMAGQPLHLLAGGAQRRLPIYDTEGGWLNLSTDELLKNAQSAIDRKFGGFKVKVGRSIDEDMARLKEVKAALPMDFALMTDANQILTLDESVRRAAQYQDLGLTWFEEPMIADDISSHRLLAKSTALPIAIGETVFSIAQFREYIASAAASVIQVDAARIGGITPWLKVAHMAQAFNLTIAPHYLMELHVSLAAAVPNAKWVEHIPQLDDILSEPMTIDADGYAVPPSAPGLGIEWDWSRIAKFTVGEEHTVES